MNFFRSALAATLALAAAAPLAAQSGSIAVDTRWSLYLAGGNTYSNAPAGNQFGLAPTSIALNSGTNRQLRVTATGSSAYCGAGVCIAATPDGPSIGGTGLNASGKISGINASSSGFLAAVFLGASLPASAPAAATFNNLDFTSFAPLLGQVFFVGDGFTSGAVQQIFDVPNGASFLYFGIADGGSFFGDPGYYDDNVGTFNTQYAVTGAQSVVPEPSTYALMAAGLGMIAAFSRKRRVR